MLERLQAASEQTKRRIIITGVALISGVMVIAWLISLPYRFSTAAAPSATQQKLNELQAEVTQALEETQRQITSASAGADATATSTSSTTTPALTDAQLRALKQKTLEYASTTPE